ARQPGRDGAQRRGRGTGRCGRGGRAGRPAAAARGRLPAARRRGTARMSEHERNEVSGVHTDPAALDDLTSAAEKESTGSTAAGGGTGAAPGGALLCGGDMRRQLSRRRTQLLRGLVALRPIVLVVAFEIGTANANARQGGFIDLATVSAPNFVVVNLIVAGGFLLP